MLKLHLKIYTPQMKIMGTLLAQSLGKDTGQDVSFWGLGPIITQ